MLLAASRAWLRKALRIDKIDMTLTGPRLAIPLKISDEPTETRSGRDKNTTAPFYEMNSKKLWGYYHGYRSSNEHHLDLLYADITALQSEGLHPARPKAVSVAEVKVTLRAVPFRLPEKLRVHKDAAVSFFKELGKINKIGDDGWENNKALRVAAFGADARFHCEFATYFDQVGTNLTLDWASKALPDRHTTIRSGLEAPLAGKLPSLETSMLANTLGTAIMFFDRTLQRTMLRSRSPNLASIAKKGLHCTVSGVLEPDPRAQAGEYDFSFFDYGTRHEIKQETNLEPHQYLLFPVAFARELPRGGKPQLFYAAILLIDDTEFERACQLAPEKGEYVANPDGSYFDLTAVENRLQDAFTYEGFACHMLAEDFVQANEDKLLALVANS